MSDFAHPLLLPRTRYNWAYQRLVRPLLLLVYPLMLLLRALLVLPLLCLTALIDYLLNCGTNQALSPP